MTITEKNKKMKTNLIFGLLIVIFFVGCTFSSNRTVINGLEDRFEAEEITKAFYDYQTTDNKNILELFSSDYLNKIGIDSLQSFLKHKKIVLGNLKKDSLQKWETKIEKGTNSSSSYFFEYNNTYENYQVTESFKMTKGLLGKIKIIDYRYEIKK